MVGRVTNSASGYAGDVVMVEIYTEYGSLLHSVDDLYPESGSWYISLGSDSQVPVVVGVVSVWEWISGRSWSPREGSY